MQASDASHFRQFGFVVLRSAVDPGPLSEEIDRALLDGFGPTDAVRVFSHDQVLPPEDPRSGTVAFRYLPMMCERTPVSLGLLDRFAGVAAELLERAVLPGRAKGTRYYGDSGWHRDSERDLSSVAFVAYLEPLTARTGALRVLTGSHRDRQITIPDRFREEAAEQGATIETQPGDVIVFDEHVIHGSTGGRERRQWRVDFVADPRSHEEEARLQDYFAQIFPDDLRSPGYDASRYPSYGSYWQALDRPWIARLRSLGVYERAKATEEGSRR